MKKKIHSQRLFNCILLIIAFAITTVAIFTGSYIDDKENIQVGSISPKRYVAARDMVDEVLTNKLRAEAEASVGPLYKHDATAQAQAAEDIRVFFDDMNKMMKDAVPDENGTYVFDRTTALRIPVAISNEEYTLFHELSQSGRDNFKADIANITKFIYDQGITEESLSKSSEIAKDMIEKTIWNEELKTLAFSITKSVLKANLVLDESAMVAAKEKKLADVHDVMIMKNQKIVDEGEIITAEVYEKLEMLHLINQNSSDSVIPIVGSFVSVLLMFFISGAYMAIQEKKILANRGNKIILFIVYVIQVIIVSTFAEGTKYTFLPLGLFAMLIAILIDARLAIVLNIAVSMICTFIYNGNMEFLMYCLATGTAAALFMKYTAKRKNIFLVAFGVGLVNLMSYVTAGMFFENGYSSILLIDGLYSVLAGVVSVVIVVGSLPLWESAFEVNTPLRLLELTNPNNELMRRLMIETPGTYHHCLIVANLAETAAYDIGANATLARVGAYYHDVGKLKYPLCFAENQFGENIHDTIEPYSSARMIVEHVSYGEILAEENKLPTAVKNMILEHHGTTLVKFFYFKAIKRFGKENINEADYRYPGPIPQNRESAILMLADTVEAAVRSTIQKGDTMDTVENLINELIQDKLRDGQLDSSQLKISDLYIIKKSFSKVFQGMHHERIAYPKNADEQPKENENDGLTGQQK